MTKAKTIKSVWEPQLYQTVIGTATYTLRPQPLGRVMEFDALLKDIGGMFEAIGPTYEVVRDGETVETFDTEEDARAYIEEQDDKDSLGVNVISTTVQDFLAKVVETPYHLLLPLIPDLKKEDIEAAPVAQIEFLIRLLVEVNGVKWFEALLKNLLEPLLPTIVEAVIGAISSQDTASST